jgi:phosphoserine phosphatase
MVVLGIQQILVSEDIDFGSSELKLEISDITLKHTGLLFKRLNITECSEKQSEQIVATVRTYAKRNEKFSFAFIRDNLKLEAAFFDMDATVIKEESIVELAKFAGKEKIVEEITEKAMAGELSFEGALEERVATLEGLKDDIFPKVFDSLNLQPNVAELIAGFKQLGIPSYLVSGGFIQLADPLANNLGIVEARANLLEVRTGVLTGKVQGKIIGAKEKKEFVFEMAQKFGFDGDSVIAIGDGANDLQMLNAAKLAVGFCPKPVLIEHLDVLNRTSDHKFLLDVLSL